MNHGNLVTITAQQVLVMFLLILVGYLAVRVKVLGAEARQNFSSLLINLVVPAMIVDSYLIPFDPAILVQSAAHRPGQRRRPVCGSGHRPCWPPAG